jgi:NADH-quinone oxidoreductase subunit G
VLRVLANLLGLPGFEFESAQDVLVAARGAQDAQASHVQGGKLDNATRAAADPSAAAGKPATASIYQLDSIVRRAPSLQLTADARLARVQDQASAEAPPRSARVPSGGSAVQASVGA